MGHGGGWAGGDVSPGGETRSGLLGSCRDKAMSTQRNSPFTALPVPGAAEDAARTREHAPAGQRRGWSGCRFSEPLRLKPAPPAGLAASLHLAPQPQPRPGRDAVRTRRAPGASGYARVCRPRAAAGALLRGTPHP